MLTIITLIIIIKIIKNNKIKKARRSQMESIRLRTVYANAGAAANRNYSRWNNQQRIRYNGANNLSYAEREAHKRCVNTLMYVHNRKF